MFIAAVCQLDTALLPASLVNLPDNSLVLARGDDSASATPSLATLLQLPISVDSKWLAKNISPSIATLTPPPGAGECLRGYSRYADPVPVSAALGHLAKFHVAIDLHPRRLYHPRAPFHFTEEFVCRDLKRPAI